MIVSHQDQGTRHSVFIVRRLGLQTRAIPDKPRPSDAEAAFPQPASIVLIGHSQFSDNPRIEKSRQRGAFLTCHPASSGSVGIPYVPRRRTPSGLAWLGNRRPRGRGEDSFPSCAHTLLGRLRKRLWRAGCGWKNQKIGIFRDGRSPPTPGLLPSPVGPT